jgi:hypothetical protein
LECTYILPLHFILKQLLVIIIFYPYYPNFLKKSGNKKLTEVVLPEKIRNKKINFDDESIISGLDFDENNKCRCRSNFKDMNSS